MADRGGAQAPPTSYNNKVSKNIMGYNPHTNSAIDDMWRFMTNIMQHGVPADRDNAEKLYNLAKWFTVVTKDNWQESKEEFRQEIRELKQMCTPYEVWGKKVSDIAEILTSGESDRQIHDRMTKVIED
jgi:hypothetical protein